MIDALKDVRLSNFLPCALIFFMPCTDIISQSIEGRAARAIISITLFIFGEGTLACLALTRVLEMSML